jgi:uncharacterized membrane protein
MTAKQFTAARTVLAVFIAATISFATVTGNYALAIAVVIVGILVLLTLKRQVKEVTHDERNLANAGRAARYAVLAYSIIAAGLALPLFALRDQNPDFETAASALAYSACALMLLQSFFYGIIDKTTDWRK